MRAASEQLLGGHNPYPGVFIDRAWNVVLANLASERLVDDLPATLTTPGLNVFRACLHPDGFAAQTPLVPWTALRDRRRSVDPCGPELRLHGRKPQASTGSGAALAHPAGELIHVEIVAPGLDLSVGDLEGPHNRQLKRLVRDCEDVDPLGHHDRAIGCDVDDAEVDAFDAGRARADERGDTAMASLPVIGSSGMLW